jgi:hypothetical protein
LTEAQIKHMCDRFLGWKLPENFSPDGGISFTKVGNAGTPHEYKYRPVGTNVLDAVQADAMVRYMIEGMPRDNSVGPLRDALTSVLEEIDLRKSPKLRAKIEAALATDNV